MLYINNEGFYFKLVSDILLYLDIEDIDLEVQLRHCNDVDIIDTEFWLLKVIVLNQGYLIIYRKKTVPSLSDVCQSILLSTCAIDLCFFRQALSERGDDEQLLTVCKELAEYLLKDSRCGFILDHAGIISRYKPRVNN